MMIIIITVIFDYLLATCLVGIATFSIFREKMLTISIAKIIIGFAVVFFILDIYYLPALHSADIQVIIGNEDIRSLFNLKDELIPIKELFKIELFDFIIWFIQSFIAYFFGRYIYNKFTVKP